MNVQDKIDQLTKELLVLSNKQKNCKHIWLDPIFDSEKVRVQDDRSGYETHGVDRWPILSFHDENKDRWSRECSDCGLKEYSYTQEVVSVNKRPKF